LTNFVSKVFDIDMKTSFID